MAASLLLVRARERIEKSLMKRWLLLILCAVALGVAGWWATRGSDAPEAPMARVRTETLVSELTTNGRSEPLDWAPVHAARAGRVLAVEVREGAAVSAGAVLARLASRDQEAALASSEARLKQARSELAVLESGGRASELAQIDGALKKLRGEAEAARRDAAALERLVEKGAATRAELNTARDLLAGLEAQIAGESARRGALVMKADLESARAKVAEAESTAAQARQQLGDAVIRAPRAGIVYELAARAGAWLNEGDLVAKVGDTARLKVVVHVDEPDLGRIRGGLPVTITWDASPGKEWKGSVEQTPAQVVALGTRMVGEVATVVENPARDLPPGANINARIRAQVVENAVTIPKSALRREGSELGVLVLDGARLAWRKVQLGVSSETRAQVLGGLKMGDSVALPSERELRAGMAVTPVYP